MSDGFHVRLPAGITSTKVCPDCAGTLRTTHHGEVPDGIGIPYSVEECTWGCGARWIDDYHDGLERA